MRALHLDFQQDRPTAAAGYSLAVVGGLATALAVIAQSMVSAAIESEGVVFNEKNANKAPALPPGVISERDALQGARAIVEHLAGPWEMLFQELEQIREPNVALLALTPDARKRQIRIYAEARSFDAMVSYYRSLERSVNLRSVVLLEHEIQERDPQRPVRFIMTAAWGERR